MKLFTRTRHVKFFTQIRKLRYLLTNSSLNPPPPPGTVYTLPKRRTMSSSKRKALGANPIESPKKSKATPIIVRFYDPIEEAPDGFGRTLANMLQWPDSKLEHAHDYIQVWFPLPEGSPFNWRAPVVDSEVCSEFRSRPELRKSLQKAFTRILKFYGFETSFEGEDVHIHRSANHSNAFRNWVTRSNHNHLRISRIIRSLRVLGLEQNAQAFYDALQEVNNDYSNIIGARSLMYWRRAAVRRLALEPAEDDEDVEGETWLCQLDETIAQASEAAESVGEKPANDKEEPEDAGDAEKADEAKDSSK
ncbi:hypothetical protein FKW77_008231 [Venturia effusa]|uniref:Opioid growth factor receptor (OGFr) conserved domain-containing protein n=1 Tax=Venturia effusa TaxID=50376 RepID=A0A517LKM4_9PEZI|nr:hypothetical protein FKW77_008231 [Venturia effusa]